MVAVPYYMHAQVGNIWADKSAPVITALFGAGWWAWCDVILRSAVVKHTTVGAAYYIPGIVATLAVILMACIRRDDSDGYIGYDDEGDTVSGMS